MGGVKQGLFAGLVAAPEDAVAEFLSDAVTVEKTLDMRFWPYSRSVNTMGMTSESLPETISGVVRKYLSKHFPTTTLDKVDSLT